MPVPETTDADLLAIASAFDLISFNPRARFGSLRELKVERRSVDPEAWAIVSEGRVLARDGNWETEPRPSSRDEAFFARCRWPSAREAISAARNHIEESGNAKRS
jgi:hypothetical protein